MSRLRPGSFGGNPAAMAPGGVVAPSFRASENTVLPAFDTTVTLPTRVSGDTLVAFLVTSAAAGATPNANTDWTRQDSFAAGAGSTDMAIYTRQSNGTDNTPLASSSMAGAAVTVVSIQNPATGFDVEASGSGVEGDIVAPTVTPSGSPSMLLTGYLRSLSTGTITPPGGQTALASVSDAVGATLRVAYESLASASATGTRTATQSTSLGWGAANVVVK